MAFGVTVDFNANVAKFRDDVDKLSGKLDTFGNRADKSFGIAKKALIGFGTAFVTFKAVDFIKGGINTMDMLGKLSDRTGVATESLAGLKLAADLSDTSLDGVGKAINKLSIFMGQYADAAREIGITAEDPLEALLQFSDVFKSAGTEAERAALGNKILGRSYAEIAPLLLQGSEALREQIKQGKEYLPVSSQMAKEAAEFNDNITKLTTSSGQLAIMIGGPLSGSFNSFVETLIFAGREMQNLGGGFTGFYDLVINGTQQTQLVNRFSELQDLIADQKQKIKGLGNTETINVLGVDVPTLDNLAGQFSNLDVSEEKRVLQQYQKEEQQLVQEYINGQKAQQKKLQSVGISNVPSRASLDKFLGGRSSGTQSFKSQKVNVKLALDAARAEQKLEDLREQMLATFNPDLSALNQGLGDAQDALTTGIFTESQFKNETDRLADIFNKGTDPILDRINQMFNPELTQLQEGVQLVTSAQQSGDIDFVDSSAYALKLGQDYKVNFLDPAKDGTKELSAYADEAARNMQGAFADFLFDPFNDGLDGMLKGFLKMMQRMAAEAAAGVFDLFKSEKSGGGGLGDYLIKAIFSHDGGTVGQGGKSVDVNPIVFAGAQRFHNGGYPGLKHDEVPAILQTGERVLSRKEVSFLARLLEILDNKKSSLNLDKFEVPVFHAGGMVERYAHQKIIDPFLFLGAPRFHEGGVVGSGSGFGSSSYQVQGGTAAGGISISTTVNVSGSNSTREGANRLGDQLNARIMEVLAQEKRPGGLLNS
jgi:hypothetical protein